MIFNTVMGPDIRDDTFPAVPEKGLGMWVAGAAVPCGSTVIIDTSVSTGKKVVPLTASGTAHDEHLIVGAYSNELGACTGGTGAVATVSGTTGRAAVTNDPIVISKGPVKALVNGNAAIVVKAALKAFTTAGLLCHDSVWPAGSVTPAGPTINFALYPSWPAFAIEAYAVNATAAKMVYIP